MDSNVVFFISGWVVALALGVIPILIHLQLTGHIRFDGDPVEEPEGFFRTLVVGCGDRRCDVNEVLFGGAASFAPGYVYTLFGYNLGGVHTVLGSFFYGYAAARCVLVFVQLTKLVWILLKHRRWLRRLGRSTVVLRAHQRGCGYVTASGMLFPLYWLQKIFHWSWVESVRDFDTLMSVIAGMPILFLLGLVVQWITGAEFVTELVDVDHRGEA